MKKQRFNSAVLAIIFFFCMVYILHAGALEDAKTLGEKAAAYCKAVGKEKCIVEINNPKGQFVQGNLYVTLHGFDGTHLANPVAPKLVGQNHKELKDANDQPFVKEEIEIAKTKGSGWISYSWTNPVVKKVQRKKSWIQTVNGMDIYTCSGVFQ